VFEDYVKAGWALCIIERGKKHSTYEDWNTRPIDAETAQGIDGAGLLHAHSGTCAIDIDDISAARPWLAERGVDLDALLNARDAVRIDSGRPGRAKLLYRLSRPLRTVKPQGSGLELRCATAEGRSVQDVLPPTIHPTTRKPYEWRYGEPLLGDWRDLPAIPAKLKAAWRELLDVDPTPPKTNGDMAVALEKLHGWIENLDPNMDYERWIKVGMKLHHATHGAEEGLALWDSWSAKATRRQGNKDVHVYTPGGCRVHWVSFSSPPGKVVATLDAELPADADEFEIIEAPSVDAVKAARQAKTQARQGAIAALEARVVYVLASEKYFDTHRHALIGSDSALEHQFTSMMPRPSGGGPRMNPVKVLKQSTSKTIVEGLGFHPGEGALFKVGADTFANTYRNRLPEPIEPTPLELEKIEWLFARLEDTNYRTWLKQYYGHVVQRPSIKIKTAPLLWSAIQRNGKSTLVKHIPKLLVGPEFSVDVSYDLLNSDFNDYLTNAWHVNLTEFRAGTRGERTLIANKLKAYIADDEVPLHPKGGRAYTMPNHFFVTASSNEEDAAAIDNYDERWGIYEFKHPKYTAAERQWIYHEFLLLPRAAAVLRHYFLHIDLTGFHAAGEAPSTESKREMVAASLAPDLELLTILWEERAEFFAKDVVMTLEVQQYLHRHCVARPSLTRIGQLLAKPPFNGQAKQFRDGEKRYRAVIVKNHDKWANAFGKDVLKHIRGDEPLDFEEEVDLLS